MNNKNWTMSSLTRDDWDFSRYKKIPSSAISRIYLWEMDRDLGSGKGPFAKDPANKKWLASLSKEKTHTILPNAPVVSSSGNSHKTRGGDAVAASGSNTLHVFQVNWNCSQAELVEAFSDWLEFGHGTPYVTFPTNTRGRPRQQFTMLEKLTIHRFHQVGYSGGPKFFRENKKDPFRRNLKRINWTLAQREMNLHFKHRTKELSRLSKAAGKNWKSLLY